MEVATVVSIVPLPIRERKPLLPAEYNLDPASPDDPKVLEIQAGINDIYVGEGRGQWGPDRSVIRVPVHPNQLADAIVRDWVSDQFGVILPDCAPGLFWVQGEMTPEAAKKRPEFQRAAHQQMNWFRNLVRLADDDWNKYRQHKTISDIQRQAAKFLKLDRPWLLDSEVEAALSECPTCFQKVHPRAIVCAHCRHILDQERYQRMQFAPAV